jgi:hypothetical protein
LVAVFFAAVLALLLFDEPLFAVFAAVLALLLFGDPLFAVALVDVLLFDDPLFVGSDTDFDFCLFLVGCLLVKPETAPLTAPATAPLRVFPASSLAPFAVSTTA